MNNFENIYHVESLLVSTLEDEYANELLKNGWKLLDISHNSQQEIGNHFSSYSKYILGADKETYLKFNLEDAKESINNRPSNIGF